MSINFWAILLSAVMALVLGFLWFGPIFGKMWMHATGATAMDKEARMKMQKASGPLYVIQFLLTMLQVYILAYYIVGMSSVSAFSHAFMIWLGFVMPVEAGMAMWNNDSAKVKWTKFLLQAGYQLLVFIVFAFIIGMWK